MRAELAALIQAIADAEAWPASFRDKVLVRAVCGPLSDLLPNLAHFGQRAARCDAERDVRLSCSRRWRANEDLTNRGY